MVLSTEILILRKWRQPQSAATKATPANPTATFSTSTANATDVGNLLLKHQSFYIKSVKYIPDAWHQYLVSNYPAINIL